MKKILTSLSLLAIAGTCSAQVVIYSYGASTDYVTVGRQLKMTDGTTNATTSNWVRAFSTNQMQPDWGADPGGPAFFGGWEATGSLAQTMDFDLGRYLTVTRDERDDHLPYAGQAATVVVRDLETADDVFIEETTEWDSQLGAQVQWHPPRPEVCFNVMGEGNIPHALSFNLDTKVRRYPDGRRVIMNLRPDRNGPLRFCEITDERNPRITPLTGLVGSGHPTIHRSDDWPISNRC
ncbi:MAG: hypothetical protein ACP5I4_14765 [Oceanipulchritudo sp.]